MSVAEELYSTVSDLGGRIRRTLRVIRRHKTQKFAHCSKVMVLVGLSAALSSISDTSPSFRQRLAPTTTTTTARQMSVLDGARK